MEDHIRVQAGYDIDDEEHTSRRHEYEMNIGEEADDESTTNSFDSNQAEAKKTIVEEEDDDDGSCQGLLRDDMEFLRQDLNLFHHDYVTDPFMDYDESDSECSVQAAKLSIAEDHQQTHAVNVLMDNTHMEPTILEVPTTNAGLMAMDVTMKDRSFIPLHAVLNNCGTLLVRKQSKLSGTLRQQHFLHKIAAVSPGQSLPLLYPEAMLFPSIFYKGMEDGSVLGAIPCAYMTRSTILKKQGIADIPDQMRSRITNTSTMQSTDPRYITYAFDCVMNLNLRQQDSRILLSRAIGTHGPAQCGVGEKEQLFDSDSIDSRPVVN
jgi:hypothetical protein